MKNPVNVKLKGNFYNNETKKSYSEIIEGCLPHQLLKVLTSNNEIQIMGWPELQIDRALSILMPELSKDVYGNLVSLPMLIKDFMKSGLISYYAGKYKITDLGKQFLKNNIILK